MAGARFGTSPVQIGTAALVSLATTVGLFMARDNGVYAPDLTLVSTGSTMDLAVTPLNAAFGSSGFLRVVEQVCVGTGSTNTDGRTTWDPTYRHCNIDFPYGQVQGSGALVRRITYKVRNNPSQAAGAALVNIRYATGATASGKVMSPVLNDIPLSNSGVVVTWGTGAFRWVSGDIIRAIVRSSETTNPLKSLQAILKVEFEDLYEGQN